MKIACRLCKNVKGKQIFIFIDEAKEKIEFQDKESDKFLCEKCSNEDFSSLFGETGFAFIYKNNMFSFNEDEIQIFHNYFNDNSEWKFKIVENNLGSITKNITKLKTKLDTLISAGEENEK